MLQKLPHLLSSDILYHLPLNQGNPPWWEDWAGPLTTAIDRITHDFFASLLDLPSIPEYSTLISQISLRHGGLGILCPRTRAAPDFVITMTSALRNASCGFRIHKNLPPFTVHSSLGDLFDSVANPELLILRRFHILLPLIANIACPPSTPNPNCVDYFLHSVSPHSARDRIKNIAVNTSPTLSIKTSTPTPPNTYTSFPACFPLTLHTLSSVRVTASPRIV